MADFDTALALVDQWVDAGAVPGVGVAIWHKGAIVAERQAGFARDDVPVGPNTLFALASVSKPISAAAIMTLVQDGDLSLDDPVADQLPEFAETLDPLASDVLPQLEMHRETITLRHLLSHTSGLPENQSPDRLGFRSQPSLDALVDVMCGLPLVSMPGERLRYSNVGIAVAARLAEHVMGDAFTDIVRTRVLAPLQLDGVAVQPSGDVVERIAITADPGNEGTVVESYNSDYWREMAIPWGGYFGTASALATFAATFLPGQESILDSSLRNEMTRDQTDGAPGGVESAGIFWNRGAWGLGWEVAADKRHHWTGSKRSPGTFCHWGQSGTLVWADPERNLVLAVFGNRAVRSPWPLRPPLWATLSDAIVTAADQV